MNRRNILIAIMVAALVAAAAIFFATRQNVNESTDGVIRIGAILPLTGQLAYLGQEERNALLLAQSDLNSDGHQRPVQLIFEDSKGSAKDGVSAYRKLMAQNVSALITSLTIVAEAIEPLCEQDSVLQVALSVDSHLAARSANTIQVYYSLKQEVELLLDQLFDKAARVAALTINVPESTNVVESVLKPGLERRGIAFVGFETYDFAATSLRNQLTKLAAQSPDMIYTVDFGYLYPTLLRDASEIAIREKIVGGLGMMTAPAMPADLTNGIKFAAASFVIKPTESFLRFKERFSQTYKSPPTFDGVYAYDALSLLAKGMREDRKSKGAFVDTSYNGLSGTITIGHDGSSKVDMSLGVFVGDGTVRPAMP